MLRGMWGCWSYKNDNFKEDLGPSFHYLKYPEKCTNISKIISD